MKKFLLIFSAIIVCTFFTTTVLGQRKASNVDGVDAPAAVLLSWNTTSNLGTETTEPSTANDPNLAAANLTQGTITAAANGNRFGGSGWFNTGNTAAGNTLAEAVAGNDYIQFVVTPNSGFSFTPTSLVFVWDRSGSGPSNVTLRSSADGFTADLGTVTGVVSGALATNTISISGLTNLTSATTFRVYGYGATATSGTGGFDTTTGAASPNVVLNGTTASNTPTVNLSVDTNSASETGPTSVTVTATASAAVAGDQTVSLAVTGTGITAGDYTLAPTTITILNGATQGTATFTVVDDGDIEGSETATITASNPSAGITLGGTVSQNIVIADNDAPLNITTPNSMPNANTGVAYMTNFMTTGGTGPYTYAVTGGAVPTGLTLNTDGTWSGTPSATGTFNFDVTVTDSNPLVFHNGGLKRKSLFAPNTATESFSILVVAPASAPANVTGRLISTSTRGLANANVSIRNLSTGELKQTRSNQRGYFNFLDMEVGNTYVIEVQSKRFVFNNYTFTLNEDLTDLVLTAQ